MKRLLVALIMCLMLASHALAKEITLAWEYPTEVAERPDFVGWKIYYSIDTPGGPYNTPAWVDVPYAGGGPDYSVTADLPLVIGTHTYYFVGVAFTQTDNSANSNEASATYTMALPPMTNFSVTITE